MSWYAAIIILYWVLYKMPGKPLLFITYCGLVAGGALFTLVVLIPRSVKYDLVLPVLHHFVGHNFLAPGREVSRRRL